jgi:hypothetical protein
MREGSPELSPCSSGDVSSSPDGVHIKSSETHRCLRGKTCERGCRGPEQHLYTTRLLGLVGRGLGAGLRVAFLASWHVRGEELVMPLEICHILNRGLNSLLDIRDAMAYYEGIAPEIWRLHPGKYGEAVQDRSFLI